jgi:hypothetical protein
MMIIQPIYWTNVIRRIKNIYMRGRSLSRLAGKSTPISCIFVFALIAFSGICRAQNPQNALVFYADKQVSSNLWAPLFEAVHNDLATEDFGIAPALLDRSPRLLRNTEVLPGEEFANVVQVKLLGRCDVVQQAFRPLKTGPLGWVLRVQGKIQPYIYIDCTRMAQVLDPTTLGMSSEGRTSAMTQAIAHVLVHEWIHIATQNADHATHGISQAQLTAAELVTGAEHSSAETDSQNPGELPGRVSVGADN